MKDGQVPNDPVIKLIQQKNYEVRNLEGKVFEAYGNNGNLVFIDYSISQVSEVAQLMYTEFQEDSGFTHRVGVHLADNEVSLPRCTVGSCYMSFAGVPSDSWYIHKPGNLPMTVNTFYQVKRQLG